MNARKDAQDRLPLLTAVPAARSRAAVLKVRLTLVLGSLLLTAATGLFAAVAFLTFDPPVVDLEETKPRGRALAELAANAYLTGQPLPVPALTGETLRARDPVELSGPLTWDGFIVQTLPGGERVERHEFLFYRPLRSGGRLDETGQLVDEKVDYQLMTLSVLVVTPATGNPVLGARPQFAPTAWRDNGDVVADYSDAEPVALPRNAAEQLRTWGQAWASDDAERLKLLTGDRTDRVRYLGLGGFEFKEMRVVSAIRTAADGYLVRARLTLVGANGSEVEMDMDITVDSASTGLPNVVGWGPAGSGVTDTADVRVPVSD